MSDYKTIAESKNFIVLTNTLRNGRSRKAFNQVHRYSKEGFNSEHSLYKYLKLFVISNGTDSRYLANTTQRNKNSFDFTMHWAKARVCRAAANHRRLLKNLPRRQTSTWTRCLLEFEHCMHAVDKLPSRDWKDGKD